MRINNNVYINRNQYTPRFKGSDDAIQEDEWPDDCVDPVNGRVVLDEFRKDHWENTVRYYLLYKRECNIPQIELDEFIREHSKYAIPIDEKYFGSYEFVKVEPNVYRGPLLKGDLEFEVLKKAGIQRIIEFKRVCSRRKKLAQKHGIKYTYINLEMPDIFNMEAFKTREQVIAREKRLCELAGDSDEETQKKIDSRVEYWEKESRKCIDSFTDFIYAMQNEKVYIFCGDGVVTTDTGIFFDFFFNPKRTHHLPLGLCRDRQSMNEFKGLARNLYLNLTEEDKKKMGWDKEFEELFLLELRRR